MDSQEVLARFEAERQALALMNHPNIARVFEAGLDDRGRPYIAMELDAGVPITEFCNREKLTLNARLELLSEVCVGVQHAHQKGVIHRDLKPTNILVGLEDGAPRSSTSASPRRPISALVSTRSTRRSALWSAHPTT